MAKKLFWFFVLAGGISMISSIALGADDVMPNEVRALIGMKLQSSESTSNFISMGSSGVGEFGIEEGVVAGKWPVLIVERIAVGGPGEILDVLMLPKNLINWHFVGGELKNVSDHFKFIKDRLSFSQKCEFGEDDERIIVGLIKPEKGKEICAHYSKHVKLAWMIDRQSGKITPISTQGLQCFYLVEDDCPYSK
ncbi:MAG: hypothetical protein HYZ46_09050 [Nitrosomonadales bacterium]|nr:hypothetical protein [Nitrosomonadales bacterium]